MKLESDEFSPQLESFEQWLSERPVNAHPDLLARVRTQIATENEEIERKIDALFAQDPSLRNPRMTSQVRARIQKIPDQSNVIWFQWLTPVAAAVVLGIAFFSFQTKAPLPEASFPAEQQLVLSAQPEPANDSELTRIFALASNLEGTSDMSRLQSVDDLAFLFE
jgi:hypothetical protein